MMEGSFLKQGVLGSLGTEPNKISIPASCQDGEFRSGAHSDRQKPRGVKAEVASGLGFRV